MGVCPTIKRGGPRPLHDRPAATSPQQAHDEQDQEDKEQVFATPPLRSRCHQIRTAPRPAQSRRIRYPVRHGSTSPSGTRRRGPGLSPSSARGSCRIRAKPFAESFPRGPTRFFLTLRISPQNPVALSADLVYQRATWPKSGCVSRGLARRNAEHSTRDDQPRAYIAAAWLLDGSCVLDRRLCLVVPPPATTLGCSEGQHCRHSVAIFRCRCRSALFGDFLEQRNGGLKGRITVLETTQAPGRRSPADRSLLAERPSSRQVTTSTFVSLSQGFGEQAGGEVRLMRLGWRSSARPMARGVPSAPAIADGGLRTVRIRILHAHR